MDAARFDRITTEVARRVGRRRAAGLLGLGVFAATLGLPRSGGVGEATPRHRRGVDRRREPCRGSGALAPAKKKKCKGGLKRCIGGCVDLATSPGNCGRCGNACPTGQGCANGTCTPTCDAPNTRCGAACVDTRTDSANCGSCGRSCGSGQSCQSSQCAAGCGIGQILCSGSCVASVGNHPCCSDADCGGPHGSSFSNDIACDTTIHQCRCIDDGISSKSTWGICQRYPDGRGRCDECCLGSAGAQGGLNCQGEWGCNGQDICSCPAGYHPCSLGDRHHCYRTAVNADLTWDPTHCPQTGSGTQTCYDCTEGGTKPYTCCWSYTCADASGAKPGFQPTLNAFCGGCSKCPSNTYCCNDGQDTAPKCKSLLPGGGFVCPPAGTG